MHVVIATHGRPVLLRRTLTSLADAVRPPSLERVWIVENGSDAGVRAICAELRDTLPIEYLHFPDPGKAAVLREIVSRIGEGLIVFTDDDVRVAPGFLQAYEDATATGDQRVVLGGPLKIDYETPPAPWLSKYLPPSARGWEKTDDAPITKPCLLGANYAAYAQTIIEVGNFRADLGTGSHGNPVGEEWDIQQRLLAAGCRGVYVPDAVVWHYVPRERCTTHWLLDRQYRIFLTNGMNDAKPLKGATWRGLPRWMWRRLLTLRLQAWLAMGLPDPERRFEVRRRYHEYRGYLTGLRMRQASRRAQAR